MTILADSTSVSVPTKSGSPVKIECFIMYKYVPETLPTLYNAWPSLPNHKRDVIQAVREQITIASVGFDYSDFFLNREDVQKKMSYNVGIKLAEKYYVVMEYFFMKRAIIEQKQLDTKLQSLLAQQQSLYIEQDSKYQVYLRTNSSP